MTAPIRGGRHHLMNRSGKCGRWHSLFNRGHAPLHRDNVK